MKVSKVRLQSFFAGDHPTDLGRNLGGNRDRHKLVCSLFFKGSGLPYYVPSRL